jgi:NADH-quinone oxidoreductase subunit E
MSLRDRIPEIERLAARYPTRRSILIPVLWMAQRENGGWIPEPVMKEVAEIVGVTPAEVFEVVSFYTMFQRQPIGRHLICVCDTLSCAICGGLEVSAYLQKKLGIKVGETTADKRFTLQHVECIGACSEAPAMLVDEDLHGHLTPESIDRILEQYP